MASFNTVYGTSDRNVAAKKQTQIDRASNGLLQCHDRPLLG